MWLCMYNQTTPIMSFAQELQTVYKVKKAELLENKEEIQARRSHDITLFFETQVREGAKEKMLKRAEAGRPTANILEYQYNERFYVDEHKKVQRYVDQEVNYPNYRIHDVVVRDGVFQKLLKDFEAELSTEENKMYLSRWRPRDTLHVIEAIWGRNRYHGAPRTQAPEEDGFIQVFHDHRNGTGQGQGRGRGRGRGGGRGDFGGRGGRGGRGRGGRGEDMMHLTE